MKALCCLMLVLPGYCFCQTSSGYFQGHFGLDLPKNMSVAYNARFDGGVNLNNIAFFGIGLGITKFYKIPGIYLPVYGNFSFAHNPTAKFFPLIIFQPGYGFYKQNERTGIRTTTQTTSGGFTYFAGGGVGFSTLSKVKSCVTVGYSKYNYKVSSGSTYNYSGLSLRVTVFIL